MRWGRRKNIYSCESVRNKIRCKVQEQVEYWTANATKASYPWKNSFIIEQLKALVKLILKKWAREIVKGALP
jgi:hypothetical protein